MNAKKLLGDLSSDLSANEKRRIKCLQEKGTGTWLAACPSFSCGTILSATEFRDELRSRCGLKLLDTPSFCDGCGCAYSDTHALSCKVGGLVHARHDEGRDALGCLACAGFQPTNVRDEPIINPCRDLNGLNPNQKLTEPSTGLEAELNTNRGDLLMRGFWERGTDCIIDVRTCDVNQTSYLDREPASVIKSAEKEKKKKYLNDCLNQRRHFTPFVVSCEGMLGKEASTFLNRLGKSLSDKWKRPYSTTISFVRTRFAIALVRAKNKCFRGSRIHTNTISHKFTWEDGAGLNLYSTLE